MKEKNNGTNTNEEIKPGFSIVIPVYNGKQSLPDTLRSVSQLEGGPYEVIVVDDASTDGSDQLAEESGARVVRLRENQGPATARNIGAQHAQYDVIVFTDSDVLLSKRVLFQLEKHFRQAGVDAVQGIFSDVCPFANFFSQYKNLYNRFVLSQLPESIDTTFTSITAVRRSAFLASGGFDGNIRGASVEDRSLGRNLCKQGYRILLDRTIEVIHNKKLTLLGFLRNQFFRSRDLVKLLLRIRREPPLPRREEEKQKRFGTNALSTMVRIPIAYMIVIVLVLGVVDPIFLWIGLLFFVLFMYLITSFTFFLWRYRGTSFALKGLLANFIDALTSGVGIVVGLFEYGLLGKKY